MPTEIERELQAATNVTQKSGEADHKYRERLVRKCQDLREADWESLSSDAQTWVNSGVEAIKNKKQVEDFPDGEEEEEGEEETKAGSDAEPEDAEGSSDSEEEPEEDEEEDKEDVKNGKASGAKAKKASVKKAASGAAPAAKKAASKKPAPEKTAKKTAVKATGIKATIKQLILKNPSITADEIMNKMKGGKGDKPPSRLTIASIRAEFRHSLAVMKDAGAYKGDI